MERKGLGQQKLNQSSFNKKLSELKKKIKQTTSETNSAEDGEWNCLFYYFLFFMLLVFNVKFCFFRRC